LVHTYAMYIALNCKRTPRIEVAYTSYLTSSLNISAGKTPVPSSSVLFAHLSVGRKPYYNSSLSLNESINPTSTNL